jgi:GT2 family glycosyltransferase
MTKLAVLVLAWNGERFLGPCLRALAAQVDAPPFAVLVVDNGSTDGSAALVEHDFPAVHLLRTGANLGFAGGNNAGLQALQANAVPGIADVPDAVVLLNQDTEVAVNWLAAIAAGLERHPAAGILGCTIYGPDGELQHTGGKLIPPTYQGQHETTVLAEDTPAEFVTGAAMAIRRTCLEQIGLLDANFHPAYFEDVDYCYRARAAGMEVICLAHAHLVHYENSSLGAQSAAHQRTYHRNRLRFVLRHTPLDALPTTFVSAEQEEITRWSIHDSTARKRAYLDAILAVPAVLAERSDAAQVSALAIITVLRDLHSSVVSEERTRRAESFNPPPPPAAEPTAEVPDEPSEPVIAPEPPVEPPPSALPVDEEITMDATTSPAPVEAPPTPPEPQPVDIAEIMRQVRARIAERQTRQHDTSLDHLLGDTNRLWEQVYEPLNLPPSTTPIGRVWETFRSRLHHEVRSYLDPMIFRQTEFNGSVVRTLNQIARRMRNVAATAEVEALRDEVTLLREQVRKLQEAIAQRTDDDGVTR